MSTLYHLINSIRVKRMRLTTSPCTSSTTQDFKHWSIDDEIKFLELIQLYGADFSLLANYFPTRSRRQLKRKYEEVELRSKRTLSRMETQRRKCFFDEHILECKLISRLKKPNNSESSSSSDQI